MKKLIAFGILSALSLQANLAHAGCSEIYKKYAARRDKTQDILVAGTIFVSTLPAVGFWGGITPVLGVVYVAADGALTYGSEKVGFGHKILPNAFEKNSHILDRKNAASAEDVSDFYKRAKKSYYRAIEKAILKGKVPRNEQPLTSEQLDTLISEKLNEADSQNFFCKVRGQRHDGSDKHELYTPSAIRDVVVAAILSEEHGIDHVGINEALHELKSDVRESFNKALGTIKKTIKRIFHRKKKNAEAEAEGSIKQLPESPQTTSEPAPQTSAEGLK